MAVQKEIMTILFMILFLTGTHTGKYRSGEKEDKKIAAKVCCKTRFANSQKVKSLSNTGNLEQNLVECGSVLQREGFGDVPLHLLHHCALVTLSYQQHRKKSITFSVEEVCPC